MRPELPDAPSPVDAPLPEGVPVVLDETATFVGAELLSGGSPWRLLRLPGASRDLAASWRDGGRVGPGEGRFARTLVQRGLLRPRFAPEHGVDDMDDVDVIVPAFADPTALERLLAQLEGLHVTVVDDGSPEPEAIACCALEHGAALVRRSENGGPAAARNTGAFATTRDYLWFLDTDVRLARPREVLAALRADLRDPLVAAAAPRVVGTSGSHWRDRFEARWSPLDQGPRSGIAVPGAAIGYVPSASLLVRRAAFGDGFDPTLRVGEDVDLVWRWHDHGWLVRYDADVVVTHDARPSWRSWWRQRTRYGSSSADLAQHHGARLAPLRADRWTLLAWGAAVAGRPSLGVRVVWAATRHARRGVFAANEDPGHAAREVVARNMVRAGGPLARALVRTFGVVVLLAAAHPRLRRRALAVFAVGVAWRWRGRRFHVEDLPLAVLDDLAYGAGVATGAWRHRSLRALLPDVGPSSMGWRDVLGLPARADQSLGT